MYVILFLPPLHLRPAHKPIDVIYQNTPKQMTTEIYDMSAHAAKTQSTISTTSFAA